MVHARSSQKKSSDSPLVQIPVYQRVGGLELVPDHTVSAGVKMKFWEAS